MPGTTGADEMNFVMNHIPGAGSIARPDDHQSSSLPLYHGSFTDLLMDCTDREMSSVVE